MDYIKELQKSRQVKKRIIALHKLGYKQVRIAEATRRKPQYVNKVIKDWAATILAGSERSLKDGKTRAIKRRGLRGQRTNASRSPDRSPKDR